MRQQIVASASESVPVILMCANIASVDSAGIGAIIASHLELKKRKSALYLIEASEPVKRTLQMLKLNEQLPFYDSIDAVLNVLNPQKPD